LEYDTADVPVTQELRQKISIQQTIAELHSFLTGHVAFDAHAPFQTRLKRTRVVDPTWEHFFRFFLCVSICLSQEAIKVYFAAISLQVTEEVAFLRLMLRIP
jgi:hypothetical protein